MTAIPTPVLGEDGKLAIVTPTRQRRRKAVDGERSKPRVLITIIMGVIAVAWLFPLVGLLVTSVRDKADVDSSGWWTVFTNPFGQNWTLNNFSEAWESLNVSTSFWNSLAVTIPATVLPIMVAAMAAYAFTFFQFRGKEIYFAVVLALMVVPIQLAIIPVLQLFVWFGNTTGIQIIGQYPAAWIVHSTFALPLAIYILRNYMSTLPNSLIEAARVDGATSFRTFLTVGLPAARPAASMLALFTFVSAWNNFFWPFIVLDRQNPTLPVALSLLQSNYFVDYSIVLAGVLLATIPLLILFVFAGRQLVSGIMQGAVKG